MFVGGQFPGVNLGVDEVNYIAKYDINTDTWSGLSSGLNNYVRSLLYDSNNNILYVGGDFTELADGTTGYNGIGAYNLNSNTWSPLGSGLNGSCYALSIDLNGVIYAGGNFNTAGGNNTGPIATWDGTNWASLNANNFTGTIYSIDINTDNNIVYAGGDFNLNDEIFNFMFYDQLAGWLNIDNGFNSIVNSILVTNGEIFFGGNFISTQNETQTLNKICKLSNKYVMLTVNNELIDTVTYKKRTAIIISNSNGYLTGN